MPRYIDVDKAITAINNEMFMNESTKSLFRMILRAIPTADVVPRAEVDELKKERDEYKKHVDEDIIYVNRIKAEVAKEIFEEIITTAFSKMPSDVLMVGRDYDFTDGVRMGKREAIIDMINILAELKKKYTEDQK